MKDFLPPYQSSVSQVLRPDCTVGSLWGSGGVDRIGSGKVHDPSFPVSSDQSADRPKGEKADAQSDCKESGRVSSQCKDKNIFSTSSEKKHNVPLSAESVESEQGIFQTSAQSRMQDAFLPQVCQGAFYLPSGFYVNVGSAYCGGCQLYGTLLQRLY